MKAVRLRMVSGFHLPSEIRLKNSVQKGEFFQWHQQRAFDSTKHYAIMLASEGSMKAFS
jgi:hypothetical protein